MATSPRMCVFLIEILTGRLLAVDAQAAEQFSIGPASSKVKELYQLFPELSEQECSALFDQNDKQGCVITTLVRRSDGSEFSAKLNFLPLAGAQGELMLLTLEPLATGHAIISHRDALTGLPDRRELVAHHQHLLQAASGRPTALALLFMDLDQFKQINDRHGHAVGDQVLATLAGRWQSCVRDGDLVARYGGDEFVVLLAGILSREEVKPVVARLTAATTDPILVGDEQLTLGVTIGVAVAENPTDSLDQLLLAADRDMYALKRAGN